MTDVVVFDLDDTLFPEYRFVLSGFNAVGEWVADKYFTYDFYLAAKKVFEQGHRGNIFNMALDKLGIEYDSVLINEMLTVYREHIPDISTYEDANWAISFYRQKKRLGIITDGYFITQRNKVRSLGIELSFDVIVYSDELGRDCWKPSKVPYMKLMDMLGAKGDECIYIADNPNKDFITAKSLGWRTVQICRPEGEYSGVTCEQTHQADCIVSSLYQLREIIT